MFFQLQNSQAPNKEDKVKLSTKEWIPSLFAPKRRHPTRALQETTSAEHHPNSFLGRNKATGNLKGYWGNPKGLCDAAVYKAPKRLYIVQDKSLQSFDTQEIPSKMGMPHGRIKMSLWIS